MASLSRIRARLLRWDAVLTVAALALPLAASSVLGFFWLYERGWFAWFVAVSIALGGAVWLAKRIARWRRDRAEDDSNTLLSAGDGVQPDPDWTERETRAYRAAQTLIHKRIGTALPWDYLQDLGRDVVEIVAAGSGEKARGALDFTLPEALLLIERVASRFRADLRDAVPFSDSIRLRTLIWLWRNRARAQDWARKGYGVWRVVRLVKNPPVGLMQEIDSLLAGGHSGHVSAEALALGQIILLEEVAKAAVELYSGRLRFSDAELLEMQVADGARDRARLAAPDAPLRIAVTGQTSAGKSTLVNALLKHNRAETDAMPTTETATAHPVRIGSTDCVLLDLPGLDGGKQAGRAVQDALDEADMVLWVLRANRPARAIDARTLDTWRASGKVDPTRRMPRLVPVLTGIDTLFPDWPYPEHHLPTEVALKIGKAVQAVSEELSIPTPVPASAIEPDWNIGAVEDALRAQIGEALMVQRNRMRRTGARGGAVAELRRSATGLSRGLRQIARRMYARGEDIETS